MQALIDLSQQYQVVAAASGLVLLLLFEQAHPFFDFFKGSVKEKGKHLFRNLLLGFINSLLISIVFVSLWVMVSTWAEQNNFGILHWLGLKNPWRIILAILLFDLWMYTWHWMNHVIPFFWRFHRVHHSDPNMDVTTASRFHVGEIFFSSLFRIGIIAITGIYVWELLLYEMIMFAVVQFHHANIVLPPKVDKFIRIFIITPAMHKVHHSRWQPETDSNYGAFLTIWDRLGRTFRLREKLEEIRIGLDEFDSPEHESVKGLFRMPLWRDKKTGED
jgi:sterol desaturase/sphingolipid hydroxylase (fatty acid hydroxylase superfamily)